MSRIIRSLDRRGESAHRLDLAERPMGPDRSERPRGGFSGHAAPDRTDPRIPLAQARLEEAERVLAAAQRQAEQIQRDAWHAGFEQGEKAGERLALQKIQPTVDALRELLAVIEGEQVALARRHENELIKIAFMIATRVVRASIELEPQVVSGIVEAALAKVAQEQQLRLCLAPADLQLIEHAFKQAAPAGWNSGRITLEADESLQRGGCRIIGDKGVIDAAIETQLRALREQLWEESVGQADV